MRRLDLSKHFHPSPLIGTNQLIQKHLQEDLLVSLLVQFGHCPVELEIMRF